MFFNSFEFLLIFLPIVVVGFFVIGRLGRLSLSLVWLIAMSLIFHSYWKASYTWLLVASILFNYLFGALCRPTEGGPKIRQRYALIVGLTFNLSLLAYFKYAAFAAGIIGWIGNTYIDVGDIVLPLAISFYTFQHISFLVDTYRGHAPRYSFVHYVAYLAFFPHLIAGPIVRHDNLIHQLSDSAILRPRAANIASGLAIIMIGLFKKAVLADGAASFVDPIFAAAAMGGVGCLEAWMAAVLFSFVIYFDFSGYSDIAIGLARLFNVRFPENFASPYKSPSIILFWRRWHMTLSRFLRVYVYVPLGGNRKGRLRQLASVMVTMLLGGLWHGAGWTFIAWGGLHGVYLIINHTWKTRPPFLFPAWSGRLLTYVAVVVAWVFFRSASFLQAQSILASMAGLNGFAFNVALPEGMLGNSIASGLALCTALLLWVNLLPNTQEFMRLFRPVIFDRSLGRTRIERWMPVWRLRLPEVSLIVMLGIYAMSQLGHMQAFIYFRF